MTAIPFGEGDEAGGRARHRVTTVELFFDLVFVFTLTNLAGSLEHELTWITVVRVGLVFIVLFWMYGAYAWLTNEVPPVTDRRRLTLLAGMAAFVLCAIAAPRAFDDRALAFGIGYLLVVLIHAGLYVQVAGREVARFAILNTLGAAALIAAASVDGPAVYALWTLPILLQWLAPMLVRRAAVDPDRPEEKGFRLDADHFVERHGLLLLVALGESVVAVGLAVNDAHLSQGAFLSVGLALLLVMTFWWAYFDIDDRIAEQKMEAASTEDRIAMAIAGYFYAFIPMLGIVITSAGLSHAIEHQDASLDGPHAWLLAVGVAAFLAGTVLFRRAIHLTPIIGRVIVIAIALGSTAVGQLGTASAQLALLSIAMIGLLGVERHPIFGPPARRSFEQRG